MAVTNECLYLHLNAKYFNPANYANYFLNLLLIIVIVIYFWYLLREKYFLLTTFGWAIFFSSHENKPKNCLSLNVCSRTKTSRLLIYLFTVLFTHTVFMWKYYRHFEQSKRIASSIHGTVKQKSETYIFRNVEQTTWKFLLFVIETSIW